MALKAADPVASLYENFMAIDSAESKPEHRGKYLEILSAVNLKDNTGAKKLSADFIGRLFKYYPEEGERSIQALAELCVDTDLAIRKSATETLVEICKINPSYVKRVADLLIQMYGLADVNEVKGLQQCLVKLLKLEPKQALEGLLDQIVSAEDIIRKPAIMFLRTKLGELPPTANNTEIATLLITEYKKILPEATAEEFENLVGSLATMKFFQTLTGGQMLVDVLVDCMGTKTPYASLTPARAERLIACCRHALPLFSRIIQSTKLVEYFCDHIIPSISVDTVETNVPVLQVFAELCSSVGELKNYQGNLGGILQKLLDVLPSAPVDTSMDTEHELPPLHFAAVECLLCAFHLLGKRHPQFITENAAQFQLLRSKLQYFSSCMQLYMQKSFGKESDADAIKRAEATRRTTANIKSHILEFFHNPPHFKDTIHLSWKKENAGAVSSEREPITHSSTTATAGGKIRTKRITSDANGSSGGSNIRANKFPYLSGNGQGQQKTAGSNTRTKISLNAPAADQTKLEARAKRFGGAQAVAASAAVDGTNRFVKTKKI
ncbi:hypothetical protein RvY_00871 [Ramazzottius varieornatus]|uniref:Apoptosis inhibitor 5 n=1 Tax=Ramazzottius varieornatus TaxID=947166 RepID=A0A1D1UEQ2_RAMVA|nr:hypothetical protein RvY_00871 [Ramazzottius varieornatus]